MQAETEAPLRSTPAGRSRVAIGSEQCLHELNRRLSVQQRGHRVGQVGWARQQVGRKHLVEVGERGRAVAGGRGKILGRSTRAMRGGGGAGGRGTTAMAATLILLLASCCVTSSAQSHSQYSISRLGEGRYWLGSGVGLGPAAQGLEPPLE